MRTIEFLSYADYEKLLLQSEKNNAKPKLFESVRYDQRRSRIVLGLGGDVEIGLSVARIGELADVAPKHLKEVRLSASGDSVVFLAADVHISADELLRDMLSRIPREALLAQFASEGD